MGEQQEQSKPWDKKGEAFWRAFRYLSAIGVGYLLGLMAGVNFPEPGPGLGVVIIVSLLALWLVFRKGQQSVSHAAVDAVLAADARANAAAVASQQVNIAGGHLVQSGDAPSAALDEQLRRAALAAHAEATYLTPAEEPPVEAYESSVWSDVHPVEAPAPSEWDRLR